MKKTEFTIFTQTTHSRAAMKSRGKRGLMGLYLKKMRLIAIPLLLLLGWSGIVNGQCALVCNDVVNISLPGPNEDCELSVTVDMLVEDPGSCNNPLVVTIMDLQGNVIPTNPVIDENYIGETLIYQVSEDIPAGNSCWGTMNVEDKLGPYIEDCDDFEIYCLLNTDPDIDGGDAPSPSFSDCSNFINWTYIDDIQVGDCNDDYTQIITRTWNLVDAYANVSTCTQTITVLRVSLADWTPDCPGEVTEACDTNGAPDTDPSVTGYPTIDFGGGLVVELIPGANNTCSIASSYQDEVFDLCGGGTKILRTWTVYDWCMPTQPGINPLSCIQVIKTVDEIDPVINCQSFLVVGSVSGGCAATVVLPAATVTDECSDWDVQIITPFGLVDGNGGILPNVPVGQHDLLYVATDACGNSSNCPMTLIVEDSTPPVAICDEFTTVSLSDSTAIVSAVIFDDGSIDNCEVDYFEVRRMESDCRPAGSPFGPYVDFDCCDIGENVMIALRVYDTAGNHNDCMIEVEVQDKIDPTIICPVDKTVECGEDIPGVQPPIVDDNCPGVTWDVEIDDQVTSCGTGHIFRTYTATDAQDRSVSCVQTITVENNDPFDSTDIIWPDDYETFECGASLDPEDLETPYDGPLVNESDCDLVAVTYTDQELPTNPPACTKILRKWIVIDWCQFNPNLPNSGGYWEHTQIVRISDIVAPELICPADTIVYSLDFDCNNAFVALNPVTAIDCSENFDFYYTINHNSDNDDDAFGNTPDASGDYPFGVHTVDFEVEDLCGNSSTCEFTVTVLDGKKPTPVCLNGLAVELMPDPTGNGGMIEIEAALFDSGSYDNCTDSEDLELVLEPNFFDCDDLGTQIVTLTVTDEAGNSDFCETYVIIQDNMTQCDPDNDQDGMVAGLIDTEMGDGVEDVMIEVSGNGPSIQPVMTNDQGNYQFIDLNMGYDYTFTPNNNSFPLNGVTTLDLVFITKHILQTQLLDSPYKIIAADVNNSGGVTTLDVVALRRLILQINTEFTNNNSWRFVDASYVFPNPENPFVPGFPEVYNINNFDSNDMDVDFVGVKIGDVNNSAQANYLLGSDDREADGLLTLEVEDFGLMAGQTYSVDFKAKDFTNIFGFQFTLEFDTEAARFVEMIPGDLENLNESNFGFTMLDEGIITTSWDNSKNTLYNDGTVLFSLTFQANNNTTLSDLFQITSQITKAEAYKAVASSDGFEVLDMEVEFTNHIGWGDHTEFIVYQNRPNPFSESTIIAWEMPEAGWSKLTITDVSGKILKVVDGNYPKGYNEIRIRREELRGSQVLFYRVENICDVVLRKMIMID